MISSLTIVLECLYSGIPCPYTNEDGVKNVISLKGSTLYSAYLII